MTIRKTYITLALMICYALETLATGWPANYEGVMLQGFSWDSYSDTRWTNLKSKAGSYSKYFSLIWIPNSGNCGSGSQMGYMPQYWFTNHNSSFGSESELRDMISTYKSKGTGIIADVVINHRNGVTGWYDFPVEQWNGQTWQIGLDGICCNDNLAGQPGQPKPTGAWDTGESFDGCRDLDHTNVNVQNNCKNYCKFLLDDLGYSGFRLDMTKGYAGEYTKIYNRYSNPTYCVGEYWDSSYDAVKNWIDATDKESAAFDFPFKYAVNDAFASNDMTKLVWLAGYTTPQPAGMIHYGYAQYAVTFIENHDTYRDNNKFNGNIVAANAFMLCSPGTPCVFLLHYKQYTNEINKLILARNSMGVNNMSSVKVLQYDRNCYMAEVTGSKGKLVVRIGSSSATPTGYSSSQIVASGTDYCVWTTTGQLPDIPNEDDDPSAGVPEHVYVMGNLPQGDWITNVGIEMTRSGDVFTAKNVTLEISGSSDPYAYFSFATKISSDTEDWDTVNSSDRYGATSKDAYLATGSSANIQKFEAYSDAWSANAWKVDKGTYDITADFKNMTVRIEMAGETPIYPDDKEKVIYFNNSESGWNVPCIYYWSSQGTSVQPSVNYPGVPMSAVEYEDNIWVYTVPAGADSILFSDGAGSKTSTFAPVDNHIYSKSGDLGPFSSSGIAGVEQDSADPVYFNLQGIRINNPRSGEVYLKVTPGKIKKIIF